MNRTKSFSPSLRFFWFIPAFVIVCASLVGVVGGYYFNLQQSATRSEVQETLSTIADLKANQIANWYRERKGDAAVVFNTRMIADEIRQFLAHPMEGKNRQSLFTWMRTLQQQSQYKAVVLYDAQGVVRLTAPANMGGANFETVKNVQSALRTNAITMLDLHRDSSNGPIHLNVLVPIGLKPQSDQPADAAIVLQVDPFRFLYPLVQTWPTLSKTAETLLIRRDNNEVLFLNELRHRTNTALTLRWSMDDSNLPAAIAAKGREGIVEGIDYRGVPVLAALRKIPGTPWFMVAKMDHEEIYGPLHRQARMAGLMAAFIVLSITLGISLVWRQKELAHSRRELASRKETEEAVRQSEQQFRLLVETNPDAVFVQTESRFVYVNDAAIRLFGASDAQELLGQAILDRIHPDHREGVKARIADLNERKLSPPRIEETCLKMDGTPVPCEISAVPIHYKGRDGAIVFAHDITERKKSEEALRRSEEQTRLFFERQIVGMAIISPEKGWLQVNDRLCRMLGYSRKELTRMTWSEVTYHEDLAADEALFHRLLAGAINEYSAERRFIQKGGAIVFVNLSVGCVRRVDGSVDYVLALLKDMTERKRSEDALRIAHDRLQRFVDSNIVGILIANSQGDVIEANDYYLNLIGFTREELNLGQVDWRVLTPPEWLFADEKALCELHDGGRCKPYEKEYIRKDGSRVRVLLADLLLPGPDDEILAFALDITEQKLAEQALKDSEERFRRAVVDAPFPILLHAEDGSIIQASESWYEITGYTPEELATIGDWTERAYGERKVLVQSEIERLYGLDRREAEGDYVIRCKDGSTRIWDFSSAPIGRLPDGRRLVISMAMDVTERRQAEADLRQLNVALEQRVRERTALLEAANKELESFSYSISHDLRAPLRHISGFIDLLERHAGGALDDLGRQYVRHVSSASKDMMRLIESLLNFSRMGRVNIKMSQVDMEELVRGAIATFDHETAGRRIEWRIGPLPHVKADPDLMQLVWMNLIGNAIKYTRGMDAAYIAINCILRESSATDPEVGEWVFSVRDNGVGFDMEYAGKLFGVFQRLHRHDEFEGTGIGLANVQRIIMRHGGRIWAEAKVNEGAEFHFSLPNKTDTFMI